MVRKKTKAQPKTPKKRKPKQTAVPSISPAQYLEASKAFCAGKCASGLEAFSAKAKSKAKKLSELAKACNTPAARKAALFVLGVCCGVVVDHLLIKCG
jgi:hypothetical protein